MPTEKRERQRQGRAERLAREAKAKRRKSLIRQIATVVAIVAVVGVIVYFTTKGSPTKSATSTTTTAATSTTTSAATSTTAPVSAAQAAANAVAVKAGCPASPTTRVNTFSWASAPAMTIDTSKTYTATVKTTAGTFVITLDAKAAPITVNNFVFLAEHKFYNCVTFHRVIPDFMDQTGDPTGTGTGGPGYTIADEYPAKAANAAEQYPVGSVAMANTGQAHSGGSQWFIVTGAEGESLPNTYSLFGQVTSGLSVADQINSEGNSSDNGDPPDVIERILSITISES